MPITAWHSHLPQSLGGAGWLDRKNKLRGDGYGRIYAPHRLQEQRGNQNRSISQLEYSSENSLQQTDRSRGKIIPRGNVSDRMGRGPSSVLHPNEQPKKLSGPLGQPAHPQAAQNDPFHLERSMRLRPRQELPRNPLQTRLRTETQGAPGTTTTCIDASYGPTLLYPTQPSLKTKHQKTTTNHKTTTNLYKCTWNKNEHKKCKNNERLVGNSPPNMKWQEHIRGDNLTSKTQ